MGFVDSSDVRRLLQDGDLKAGIAKAVAEDPSALNDLAEDIADELEDDPEFKKQLIDAAMANPEFKQKVVREVLDDLG